jgi:hypothetical protein
LFSVVDLQLEIMFLRRTLPHRPQGKGGKLCTGDIKGFCGTHCRRNFKKGSFDWKLNRLVPFFIVQIDWKATNTLSTPTISPNISNQSFEMVIFSTQFKVQEIIPLSRTLPPIVFRTRVISYALGAYKVFY